MINVGRTQGSKAMAEPLVINKTTVYVHKNIVKLDKDAEGNETDNLYEYDEVQYGLSEYLELQAKEKEELESTVDDLLVNVIPTLMGGE